MTQDESQRDTPTRELAIVLHDLAWLLPRTIGAEAARIDPLPPSELEIMRLLSRRPGLRVAEVGRELGMHPNNVSTAIRSLEARGLVHRIQDDHDGRGIRLEPSASALEARDRREERWSLALAEALDALEPLQRAALLDAVAPLRSLTDRLGSR